MVKLAFTCDSSNIQIISHWTFTAERAICINALSICARVIETLINICSEKETSMASNRQAVNGIDSVLVTHTPFGWSSVPCWYPTLTQRIEYPSATRRKTKSGIPLQYHEYWCFGRVCVSNRTHPLPWWGRFHRGPPSLDLSFQCSSTLP